MFGTLGDLGATFTLHAKCRRCFRIGDLDVDALRARWGAEKPLGEIAARCGHCGGWGDLFRSWGRHLDFGGSRDRSTAACEQIDDQG